MSYLASLAKRRSYYAVAKDVPCSVQALSSSIRKTVEPVSEAFSMKSARVMLALGRKQDERVRINEEHSCAKTQLEEETLHAGFTMAADCPALL